MTITLHFTVSFFSRYVVQNDNAIVKMQVLIYSTNARKSNVFDTIVLELDYSDTL